MFKFLKMGRTARNRSFNYIPRYYDERKERLEAILDKHADRTDADRMKARISAGNMRMKSNRGGMTHREQSKAMFVRVLLILLALTTIAYYLVGIYLPSIAAYLE